MLAKAFRKLAVGAVAALGLCLPAVANVVVDDLEDNNGANNLKYYWYTYQFGYAADISLTPTGDFVATAGGANSSAYAAAMTFDGLGSAAASGKYPEIGMGTPLTATETSGYGSDFNNVDSVVFWAKGPGGLKFNFYVHTEENAPNSNDNKYGKLITIAQADNNVWKRYSFNLKPIVAPAVVGQDLGAVAAPDGRAGALSQAPYYGTSFTFVPAKATRLSWAIKKADNTPTAGGATSPASGTFAVDDIILIGSITAPADSTPTTPQDTTPTATTKYTLTYTVSPGAGGSLKVGGVEYFNPFIDTVPAGLSGRSVTAVPSANYSFVKWDDESTANPRYDVATENKVFTAVFELNKFTIIYKGGENGDVQVAGRAIQNADTILLEPGKNGPYVTAIGQLNPPYQFKRWSDGSVANPRSDSVTNENMTITAEFEPFVAPPVIEYVKVNYTAGTGGSLYVVDGRRSGPATITLVPTYADSLAPGDSITATAVPDSGYTFFRWSDNDTTATRTDKYAVGKTIDVNAVFKPIPTAPADTSDDPADPELRFFLAYSAGSGGKIKEGNGAPVSLPITRNVPADSAGPTITAVPDTGYKFVKWSDGLATAARTDIAKSDSMITAEFAPTDSTPKTYKVIYVAKDGGKLRIGNNTVLQYDTTLTAGANINITAIADSGYAFVKWSSGSTDPQIFKTVQADVSDTAIFQKRGDAIAAPNREIPTAPTPSAEVAVVAPVAVIAGELTSGPNPASAAVKFFRTGRAIKTGKLSVYDASGSLVTTVTLSDKGNSGKRTVGAWNLKDGKGRQVANGSYVVKGTVTTKDGVREKVSTVIAVVK